MKKLLLFLVGGFGFTNLLLSGEVEERLHNYFRQAGFRADLKSLLARVVASKKSTKRALSPVEERVLHNIGLKRRMLTVNHQNSVPARKVCDTPDLQENLSENHPTPVLEQILRLRSHSDGTGYGYYDEATTPRSGNCYHEKNSSEEKDKTSRFSSSDMASNSIEGELSKFAHTTSSANALDLCPTPKSALKIVVENLCPTPDEQARSITKINSFKGLNESSQFCDTPEI